MNILKYVTLAFVLSSACEQSMGCARWGEFSYSNDGKYSSGQDFKSKLLRSIEQDLERKELSKKIADNIVPTYKELKDVVLKKLREQNKCKDSDKWVNDLIERSSPARRALVFQKMDEIQKRLGVREQLEKTRNLDGLLKSPDAQYEDEVYDRFVAMMLQVSCLGDKKEPAGNENDSIRKIISDLNDLKGKLRDKIKSERSQKSDVIEKSTRTKLFPAGNLDPRTIYAICQKAIPNQYLQEAANENLAKTCFEYVRFLMVDFLGICVPNMLRFVDDPVILGWFRDLRNIDGFYDIFKGVSY